MLALLVTNRSVSRVPTLGNSEAPEKETESAMRLLREHAVAKRGELLRGLQRVNRGGHVRPQAGPGAGREACLLANCRHVLTGEPAAEDVHWWHSAPVDGGDVAEVRGVWPVAGEDAGDGSVYLGEPGGLGVEDVLDGEVESAVPGEQRPNPKAPARGGDVVVHEGSGSSVAPDPNPFWSPSPG